MEIVSSAVNICSNMIGCFISPRLDWYLRELLLVLIFCSTSLRLCRARSFCFSSFLFICIRLEAVFLEKSGLSKWSISHLCYASISYWVFIITYCNNKLTAGYLWFWYAVPFKRKLSLMSGGGIIRLFADKERCWSGQKMW